MNKDPMLRLIGKKTPEISLAHMVQFGGNHQTFTNEVATAPDLSGSGELYIKVLALYDFLSPKRFFLKM